MTPLPRRLIAILAGTAAPLLLLALLLLAMPAPAQAASVVVHDCTPAGLRAELNAAADSSLVTFDCTSGSPTFNFTQTQTISRDVTIDGGGVITFSGGFAVRILSVPFAEKATLLNLSLEHARSGIGSAVSVAGRLVVTDVTFLNNFSALGGAAVGVLALGTAEIHHSHFYTNTASLEGGAIYTAGDLAVYQSDFFGNSSDAGGALAQVGGTAVVAGSAFISNSAQYGGAIVADASLVLAGDQFDHNATTFVSSPFIYPGGGALYTNPLAFVVISQSVFFSNTAQAVGANVGGAIVNRGRLIIVHTLFNQNSANGGGGAIFNAQTADITRTTFIRNASLGQGGAISNTGAVTLTTTSLLTNTAGVSGGAIASTHQVFLQSSLLFNNSAPNGGGVRNHANGRLLILASTLYSNTALTGPGGAVLNNGNAGSENSTFAANDAGTSGGALQSVGASADATFTNSTIVSNTAASAGAALQQIAGLFVLRNTIVAFNSPGNCQGALINQGGNLQYNDLSCPAGITNTNPLLGPLQDNGGPPIGVGGTFLPTLLPLAGSPALNAGTAANCPLTDQRGYARIGVCDIGALERAFQIWLPLLER
ncbi:MAG: choice-of-anchor Q domain-containing protein [Anaerolineales bacterium]